VHNLSLSLEPRDDPAAAVATAVLPLLRCAKLQVEHFGTQRLKPALVVVALGHEHGSQFVAGKGTA
jgi:hypothetical protein